MFLNYTNSVITEAIDIPHFRIKYADEPQLLQYEIMELDRIRREYHESAILACKRLNSISEQLGLPPFYEGDINDRYQIADFAIDVVRALYEDNKSVDKTLTNDEYIMNKKATVPTKKLVFAEEERWNT